jgi:hypothetical protein
MSDKPPPPAAAAASSSTAAAAASLHGTDIAQVLSAKGPVVKCVLLRHMRPNAKDVKPHAASKESDKSHKRPVLTELIEEIEVDTTPNKNAIKGILGPFTFIGQFPTEGVVAMAAKEIPDEEELPTLSISQLRALCDDFDIDTKSMLEKNELVAALQAKQLPVNPHHLQPPLDDVVVRGDIILMKVAETEEVLDEPQEDKEATDLKVMSNDEFFLNYTKEEYIAFASRTDVVAPTIDEDEHSEEAEDDEEQNEEEEEEEGDEEEDSASEEEMGEEEEKRAMLNIVLAEVLKKFRAEKGRGPTSEELLQIREAVAEPLGLDVTTLDDVTKRAAEDAGDDHVDMPSPKRVKFSGSDNDGEAADNDQEDEDKKPAAVPMDGHKEEKKAE